MLQPGDFAPEFSLPDQDGRQRELSSLLGGGKLVLFFYPADFTPVCTREACLFRDAFAELAASGFSVAGVSPDDTTRHAQFSLKHQVPYLLLSDPEKLAIRAFGVDGPLGFGVRRATFVIDSDRKILAAVKADLRLSRHQQLIDDALAIES